MANLRKIESEALAKRVVHFYKNEGRRNVSLTCRHFTDVGMADSTVHGILHRYELRGTIVQKKRGPSVGTAQRLKFCNTIRRMLTKNPALSNRAAAAKLNVPLSTYVRMKVHQCGIHARKKQPVPKYVKDQEQRAKTNCRKIYREKVLSGNGKFY